MQLSWKLTPVNKEALEALREFFHDEQGPWTGHSPDRNNCRECSIFLDVLELKGYKVVKIDE
jgi:hypothetical protein